MLRKASLAKPRASLFAVIVGTVGVLYFAQEVLIPLALSILLAFLLAPLASRLESRKVGRLPAVLTVVGGALLVIALLGWTVGRQVVSLAEQLPRYTDEIVRKAKSLSGTGSGFGSELEKLGNKIENATGKPAGNASDPAKPTAGATGEPKGIVKSVAVEVAADPAAAVAREAVGGAQPSATSPIGTTPDNPFFTVALPAPVSPVKTLGTYLGVVLSPLGTGGLVLVFVIFILLERHDLRDRLIHLISRGKYTLTTRALNDAGSRISRYILAQSIVNGSYGVVVALGLLIIGLTIGHGSIFPSFILWGLVCAVLRFVPYVGPGVAALFPMAVALAVYPGFGVFLAVLSLIVVNEIISNNIVEPWLYGASTGLSTVALMVAAVFWTWLWGPVGLLLATPLTVCFVVLGKYVPQLKFLDVLLGDQPALPLGASFYQRLVAGNYAEAVALIRQVTQEKTEAEVADTLLLPALRFTRRDRADGDLSAADESSVLDAVQKLVRTTETAPASANESAPAGRPLPMVLGYPAHHVAEEATLFALAEPAATARYVVEVASTRLLPADLEERVRIDKPAVVFIAILPPGGIPQARHLCHRLRKQFPDLHLVVGFWGRTRNFDRLLVRFRKAGASYVTTSVTQSRKQIVALLPPPNTPLPAGGAASTPSGHAELSLVTPTA